jgi:TonB family protein
LIAIAVVATGKTVTSVREKRAAEPLERITYVKPELIAEDLRRAEAAKRVAAARQAAERAAADAERRRDQTLAMLKRIADTPIDVPEITMQPDLTAVADTWLAQSDGIAMPTMSVNDLLGAKAGGFVRPTNGVYDEASVERSVKPRRGNPKPRYPSALADMGIEGAFMVRFVVDSTGDVPEDKIEFPNTMHRLFASAVRTALLKSHYMPAMIAGHFVAQQVVQEFRFEVGRGGR